MNKKKQIRLGHSWGKREHKYEAKTSRYLLVGVLFIVGAAAEYIYLKTYYLILPALVLFVIAFLIHLIARVSHKREKHYMDSIRRPH
jgi:type IV secretory pathway VirB3-like protein